MSKLFRFICSLFLCLLVSSCNDQAQDVQPGNSTTQTTSAAQITSLEDNLKIVNLDYINTGGKLASACTLINLAHLSVSIPCTCTTSGACSVGVTPTAHFNGLASFYYSVKVDGQDSNYSLRNLYIVSVDDLPISTGMTVNGLEDIENTFYLSYADNDNQNASSCTLSNLSNVFISTPCTCFLGICTVGVTGNAQYFGTGGFDFDVVVNGVSSNTSSVVFNMTSVNDALFIAGAAPVAGVEGVENIVTLNYTDVEGDLATSCSVFALSHTVISTPCSCDGFGVCQVGVTSALNDPGTVSFNYTVSSGAQVSNTASQSMAIAFVDDSPVATTPGSIVVQEDTATVITLGYTDPENDEATTCSTSALSNITVTTPCACDSAGVCTVEVLGTTNYFGAASFDFTVTASSVVSNSLTQSLSIASNNDAPVAAAAVAAGTEDTPIIVSLGYSDVEGDLAVACVTSSLVNLNVSTPCACDGAGVCTVGITPDSNFTGTATFDYEVTDTGGSTSIASSQSVSFSPVSDIPQGVSFTPTDGYQDTQKFVQLSYLDPDGDLATSCSITATTNLTVTTPCSCDASGVCSVGVTGSVGYSGSADFTFEVTANLDPSVNGATATFNLNPVIGSDFVTQWNVGNFAYGDGLKTITLPLKNGYSYNFAVDWGDGNISLVTSFADPDKAHTYASSGIYTVTITGTLEAWSFNNTGGDLGKIIQVLNLGDTGWIDLSNAFYGCVKLQSFSGGHTATVTNMSGMFRGATSLTAVEVSTFNTSNVTSMSYMFQAMTSFDDHLDLSSFDTALVTDMSFMFASTHNLDTVDVASFDTANVTNMSYMFAASTLNTLDLSNFDTAAVTNMNLMFYNANQLSSLNATSWDIAGVTSSYSIFTLAKPTLVVTCDQGGSPATGTLFGKTCN